MFKFLQSKKGFTIVELMIVLVLLSLGAVALINFFSVAYRSYNKSEERYIKQEAVKEIATALQGGSGNVAAAKSANVFNTLDAVPDNVDKNYSYIYAEKSTDADNPGFFLYIRNRGETKAEAKKLSNVPVYITIKQVSETTFSGGKIRPSFYNGVTITIAALEDDYDYDSGKPPISDDIYYSVDVTYHFPNMATSEDNLLVSHLGGEKKLFTTIGNSGNEIQTAHCQALCGSDWYNCKHTPVDKSNLHCNIETGDCDCNQNLGIVLAVFCEEIISGDETNSSIAPPSLCFIATASYGLESGQVGQLCEFRDNTLMKSEIGKAFVEAYYKISPPIANAISESEPLKAVVRTALKPIMLIAEYANNEEIRVPGAISFAMFMLCGTVVSAYAVKKDQDKKRKKR